MADEGTKKKRRRAFTQKEREACWAKAGLVPGRDARRWRVDAGGAVVGKAFHGRDCSGVVCFEYDHIVPFSKGGETTAENCQLLQTRANRLKGNADLSDAELRGLAPAVDFSARELDLLEIAGWGSVVTEEYSYVVPTRAEQERRRMAEL